MRLRRGASRSSGSSGVAGTPYAIRPSRHHTYRYVAAIGPSENKEQSLTPRSAPSLFDQTQRSRPPGPTYRRPTATNKITDPEIIISPKSCLANAPSNRRTVSEPRDDEPPCDHSAFETGPDTVRDLALCKAPRNGGGSCFRVQGVREFGYGIRQELSQCFPLSRAASCSVA